MSNIKLFEAWMNEGKESSKIKIEDKQIPLSSRKSFNELTKAISNKLDIEFVYSPSIEEFTQGNSSTIYGVRFISAKGDVFRLNWDSPKFSLSDVTNVDFWFTDDSTPTMKTIIEDSNSVKLVSMIVETIKSNNSGDKFNLDDYILNLVELEEDVLEEGLSDEETIEFEALKAKYKKGGKKALTTEDRDRLIYLKVSRMGYRDVADAKFKTIAVSSESKVENKTDSRIQNLIERLNSQEDDVQTLFSDMEKLMTSVVLGNTNSLIITGTAGIGKSEALKNVMNRFDYQKERDYRLVKGAATAYGAYREFYMYRDDKLIVFDDCDDLFSNTTAINVLKGVLDTSKERTVSWLSNSTFSKDGKTEEEIQTLLKKGRIPNTFEFTSGIIFITNLLREDILADVDLQALISRSTMIDVTLDGDQLMERIKYIISKIDVGIPEDEKWEIFDVMTKAYDEGLLKGKLDIRTFIKMAQLKKTDKFFQGEKPDVEEWIRLATKYSS